MCLILQIVLKPFWISVEYCLPLFYCWLFWVVRGSCPFNLIFSFLFQHNLYMPLSNIDNIARLSTPLNICTDCVRWTKLNHQTLFYYFMQTAFWCNLMFERFTRHHIETFNSLPIYNNSFTLIQRNSSLQLTLAYWVSSIYFSRARCWSVFFLRKYHNLITFHLLRWFVDPDDGRDAKTRAKILLLFHSPQLQN